MKSALCWKTTVLKPARQAPSDCVADSDPEPCGFECLLLIDSQTGEINGQRTVYVPTPLARDVNDARCRLHLHANDPAARRHACVGPLTESVPGFDDTDSSNEADPVARRPAGPNLAQQPQPAASQGDNRFALKRRAPVWRYVRVITERKLLAQRRDIEHRELPHC